MISKQEIINAVALAEKGLTREHVLMLGAVAAGAETMQQIAEFSKVGLSIIKSKNGVRKLATDGILRRVEYVLPQGGRKGVRYFLA